MSRAEQLALIAADVAALFAALSHPIATQAALDGAWVRLSMERVACAGGLRDPAGWSAAVVGGLFEVCAAYLSLPVTQDALDFGVLLCAYVYATQPCVPQRPLPLGADAYLALLKAPLSPLAAGARRALVQARAFDIVPFVDGAAAVQAVLRAHAALQLPLLAVAAGGSAVRPCGGPDGLRAWLRRAPPSDSELGAVEIHDMARNYEALRKGLLGPL